MARADHVTLQGWLQYVAALAVACLLGALGTSVIADNDSLEPAFQGFGDEGNVIWLPAGGQLKKDHSSFKRTPVVFTDDTGDVNNLTATDGQLRWCSSSRDFGCRQVGRLSIQTVMQCQYQVVAIAVAGQKSSTWSATITDPSSGTRQHDLAASLVRMGEELGVLVTGNATRELHTSLKAHEPPITFYVPEHSDKEVTLRIPGNWQGVNLSDVCVRIVAHPEDCNVCTFSGRPCQESQTVSHDRTRLDEFLMVRVQRPSFIPPPVGAEHNHSVCFLGTGPVVPYPVYVQQTEAGASGDRVPHGASLFRDVTSKGVPTHVLLGPIEYYSLPKVNFVPELVQFGIKTFLNPGWHQTVKVRCENCSERSRLSVVKHEINRECKGLKREAKGTAYAAICDGQLPEGFVSVEKPLVGKLMDVIGFIHVAAKAPCQAHGTNLGCTPPPEGPCGDPIVDAFSSGVPSFDVADLAEGEVAYQFSSDSRLGVKDRQVLYHHYSALCFYPDAGAPNGWLVGFASVHTDGSDMQAFIGFVCFFGVALPLVCLVTGLLHHNKYELCKQRVQQLRLEYQRQQLEQELHPQHGPRANNPTASSAPPIPGNAGARSAAREARPLRNHILAQGLSWVADGPHMSAPAVTTPATGSSSSSFYPMPLISPMPLLRAFTEERR